MKIILENQFIVSEMGCYWEVFMGIPCPGGVTMAEHVLGPMDGLKKDILAF
jgi:hypothetical protein